MAIIFVILFQHFEIGARPRSFLPTCEFNVVIVVYNKCQRGSVRIVLLFVFYYLYFYIGELYVLDNSCLYDKIIILYQARDKNKHSSAFHLKRAPASRRRRRRRRFLQEKNRQKNYNPAPRVYIMTLSQSD